MDLGALGTYGPGPFLRQGQSDRGDGTTERLLNRQSTDAVNGRHACDAGVPFG